MPRPRNPRLLPACVALAMLSGCFGAPTTPVAPAASKRPGASTPPGTAATGTPPPASPASAGPSGLLPSILPVASLPPPPVNAESGKPVIQGVVRIPAKIIGNNGGNIIGQNGANLISDHGAGIIGQNGANVIGQNGASVIGQNGASVIGQNGASVIGQNGASVIGQNGASVIGQNGASVIGQNGASLKFSQFRVVNAKVAVKNAAGQPVLDGAGQPVETTTDATGSYELPAGVVPSNAIIEVTSPDMAGNTFAAYLPGDAAAAGAAIDVDVASTLVINYVRDQYVRGDQAQLDKLPRTLVDEAKIDLAGVLEESAFADVKIVAGAAIAQVVAAAIAASAEVSEVFERIESLYVLAGVKADGHGERATDVDFDEVAGVTKTPGGLLVFSPERHVLYRIGPSGRLNVLVPRASWGYPEVPLINYDKHTHAGVVADGATTYLSDVAYDRVVKVVAGKVEVVAGGGTMSPLKRPTGLARLKDGGLLVADSGNNRLVKLDPGGRVTAVFSDVKSPSGLCVRADGSVLVCDFGGNRVLELVEGGGGYALKASWPVTAPVAVAEGSGGVFVATKSENRLVKLGAASAVEPAPVAFKPGTYYGNESIASTYFTALAFEGARGFFGALRGRVFDGAEGLDALAHMGGSGGKLEDETLFVNTGGFAPGLDGDVYVTDGNLENIYRVARGGAVERIVAVNAEAEFVGTEEEPLLVKGRLIADVQVLRDGAVAFLIGGGDHPCVKLLRDGKVSTIMGNGQDASATFVPGPATQTALPNFTELALDRTGALLAFTPGNACVGRLTAAGDLERVTRWEDLDGTTGTIKPTPTGDLLVWERFEKQVFELSDAGAKPIFEASALPALQPKETVVGPLMDQAANLYIGTKFAIYVRPAGQERAFRLTGVPDGLLAGTTGDTSVVNLQDLIFDTDGNLLILEREQVKRVPAAELKAALARLTPKPAP